MKGEITSVVMDRQQAKLLDVLLIEDNPIDARLVSRLLRSPSEALKCRHVSTLAEAAQLLQAVAFDVIGEVESVGEGSAVLPRLALVDGKRNQPVSVAIAANMAVPISAVIFSFIAWAN